MKEALYNALVEMDKLCKQKLNLMQPPYPKVIWVNSPELMHEQWIKGHTNSSQELLGHWYLG